MESLNPGLPLSASHSPDTHQALPQKSSGSAAARFGRYQVFEYEILNFEETFVHNALKQSVFIHDKDDPELIKSVSTFTLTTSRYFGTHILHSVAHCAPACQAIAKFLTARDILSLSLLNRFTYQGGSHWNRLITSSLVEQYYGHSAAMQARHRLNTDQAFSESPPPKLTEWLKNHFDSSDISWVAKDTLRAAALGRYLRKWTRPVECCTTLSGHTLGIMCITRHPRGWVISGSSDTTLRVWDLDKSRGEECIAVLSGHNGRINCITTLPDSRIISGSCDRTLRVWDPDRPAGEECIAILSGHTDWVNCITTLLDSRIISGSCDTNLRVWNLDKPGGEECIAILSGHTDWVTCTTTLTAGRVISGSTDRTIRIWDLNQGNKEERVITCPENCGHISCIIALPDSRIVASFLDNTLVVWEPGQPGEAECITSLSRHSKWVTCILGLPDGQVISSSYDHTLIIWDLSKTRGAEYIATLSQHARWVTSIIILPGCRVISASINHTMKVWDLFASIDLSRGLLSTRLMCF